MFALWALAVAIVALPGCGDDLSRIAVCPSGREAWKGGGDLVCYEPDGAPYASRELLPRENEITACDFCEGFLEGDQP